MHAVTSSSQDTRSSDIVGYLDSVTPTVSGWVCDTQALSRRLRVRLVIDDTIQDEKVANVFRRDVANAQFGDGQYGFEFSLPACVLDNNEHWIAVEIVGSPDVLLQGSPRQYVSFDIVSQVRVATVDDKEQLSALLNATDIEAGFEPSSNITQAHQLIARFTRPKNVFYLAWVKNRTIGYIMISCPGDGPHGHVGVLRISVLAAYRGHKIGTSLMEQALQSAKESGLRRIELCVDPNNESAIRLYKKFGFEVEGVKRHFYFDGKQDKDMLAMAHLFSSQIDRDVPNR